MKRKKQDTTPRFPARREEFAGELTPDCFHGPISAKHTERFRSGRADAPQNQRKGTASDAAENQG